GRAFFFLLALLDDLRLGCGGSGRGLGCGGLGLATHGDDVGQQLVGHAGQFHRAGHGNVGRAVALADQDLGHVDRKVLRDVVREALDLHRAVDDFEVAALLLHAFGLAGKVHGNLDANALGQIDALQVGVEKRVLNGIVLVIDHHDRGGFPTLDGEVKNGVVAGAAVDNLQDVAGIDGNGDGVPVSAVDDSRDLSGAAGAAGFVLTARGTHLGGDSNIFSQLT